VCECVHAGIRPAVVLLNVVWVWELRCAAAGGGGWREGEHGCLERRSKEREEQGERLGGGWEMLNCSCL
jgi:hypothetical protein